MTILVIRITMNLGSLFRWAFSSARLLSDRSHSSTPRMYCVGYKGPDVLTFPFLSLSLFNYFSCPFIKACIFSLRLRRQLRWRGKGREISILKHFDFLLPSMETILLSIQPCCGCIFYHHWHLTHRAQNSRSMCGHLSVCVCVCPYSTGTFVSSAPSQPPSPSAEHSDVR